MRLQGRQTLSNEVLKKFMMTVNLEYCFSLSSLMLDNMIQRFPTIKFGEIEHSKKDDNKVHGLGYFSLKSEYHGLQSLRDIDWTPFAYVSSKYEFKNYPNLTNIGAKNVSLGLGIKKKVGKSNMEFFFDIPRQTIGFYFLSN
jgi:hypothetical protein